MAVTAGIASSGFPLGFKVRQGNAGRPVAVTSTGRSVFVAEARHFAAHHQKEAVVTDAELGSAWRLSSDEGPHIDCITICF